MTVAPELGKRSELDAGATEKYLARQPIFDRRNAVIGYELLLRSGLENFFVPPAVGMTSEQAVDNCFLFGLEKITAGRRAFINFDRHALIAGYAALLPKDLVVVEILEDVAPDTEVVAACRELRAAGYSIALDDFELTNIQSPLLNFANIVKVDFRANPARDLQNVTQVLQSRSVLLLAEKVESQQEMAFALKMGYSYFQGHYYSQPEILKTRCILGFKPNYLRLLRAVHRREMNISEIEGIIKQEPSLLYKLLRYLNSAFFYFCGTITSVRHALAMLGEENIRRWTSVSALVGLARDRPQELVIASLVRARFCELLAPALGLRGRELDLFLLGLFSAIDVIVEGEMTAILDGVAVSRAIKAALLGEENRYRTTLDMVLAYERAEWDRVQALAVGLRIREPVLATSYVEAVHWTHQIFGSAPM